jgi:hypothetical protein
MKLTPKTIAKLVTQKGKKVNLHELANKRGMFVDQVRLNDGSTVKLLSNNKEIDCIVMKSGKVVTAKGTMGSAEKMDNLYCRAIQKLLGRRQVTSTP